jgi:hypothetical protein
VAAGCTATFKGSSLRIYNDANVLLADIPVTNGLYKVEHSDHAAIAAKTVTIEELHSRLGHISPEAAKAMVEKGLVIGIHLDEPKAPGMFDSCEFAKGSRKAIVCKQKTDRFGDEIHPDVWGPAPVMTK